MFRNDNWPKPGNFPDFYQIALDDLNAVYRLITERVAGSQPLIKTIGDYILNSGGKRVRPLLVLLVAGHCGYKNKNRITLAAAIECLHIATLLHDDIIDESDLRRGQMTVNHRWDNSSSVLIGDYLYSAAFQFLVDLKDIKVLEMLSEATNTIVEGEIMQLTHVGNLDINEQDYRKVIHRKTAMLFQASASAAAALAKAPKDIEDAFRDFGSYLGLAYQLVDDALDYSGSVDQLGKDTGNDLTEGKITLPLIHILDQGTEQDKALIKKAIKHKTDLDEAINVVKCSGALKYTEQAAISEGQLAYDCLAKVGESPYKDALIKVVDYALRRQS